MSTQQAQGEPKTWAVGLYRWPIIGDYPWLGTGAPMPPYFPSEDKSTPIDPPPVGRIEPAAQGWQCPKCGRVYGPQHPVCNHCNSEADAREALADRMAKGGAA